MDTHASVAAAQQVGKLLSWIRMPRQQSLSRAGGSGDMGVWRFGCLGVWGSGDMGVWGYGGLEVWVSGGLWVSCRGHAFDLIAKLESYYVVKQIGNLLANL